MSVFADSVLTRSLRDPVSVRHALRPLEPEISRNADGIVDTKTARNSPPRHLARL